MNVELMINSKSLPAEIRRNENAKRGTSYTLYINEVALPTTSKVIQSMLSGLWNDNASENTLDNVSYDVLENCTIVESNASDDILDPDTDNNASENANDDKDGGYFRRFFTQHEL